MSRAEAYLSGKGHRDENFPVASRLIARRYRAPIMAFYRYVRTADDVADNAGLGAGEKLRLLDGLDDALTGRGPPDPAAEPLKAALAETGITPQHALDLIAAFRMDARKSRYDDWSDLLGYCRLSAMPVGRYVLDVHGEDPAVWPASDALCAVLQVVNHLQDCGADYRQLDRVYLPADIMARHGALVRDLGADAATPPLRAVMRDIAARCRDLLAEADSLPHRVRNRRLAAEIAVIAALAGSQLDHLDRHDPLAGRARPSKSRALAVAAGAIARQTVAGAFGGTPRLGTGGLP